MREKVIKVLLIDDDPDDRFLLVEMMSRPEGSSKRFAVESAEDLESGIKMLAQGGIEAVVLDLMLTDSQGIETVRRVNSRFPDIPLIVLTGLRDEALGFEAVLHGAQDYQIKGSIDERSFKRTISYAVERHRILARMKGIIERTADGMVVVDSKGSVRYLNPAAEVILGCEAQRMLGKPFPYPIPSGPDRSAEIRIPAKQGEERIAEMCVSEIEWEDEPAALASVRDITALRRMEKLKAEIKERRRMDKLKDDLVNTVSHEMRGPLTIIKAVGSSLKQGVCGQLSEEQSELVSMQYRNILRLQKIVDGILNLSRLESGMVEINAQRLDAIQIIRETVRDFRLVLGDGGIVIEEDVPRDLPPIYADSDLLIRVLGNLIDNAMRFTKTRIVVRAQAKEISRSMKAGKHTHESRNVPVIVLRKFVQISVIDDGSGIPQERIGDLFKKFVQINRNTKGEGYQGTGLGLALCKEIIERQQGKIWVESREGQGSQFHFALPQYEPVAAGGPGESHAAER